MSPKPVSSSEMFPEVEDHEVSDAQLGALVRAYRGISRPPQVIIARPTWFEVANLIVTLALAGVVAVSVVALYQTTLTNRHLESDIVYTMCSTHVDADHPLDERIRKICEASR